MRTLMSDGVNCGRNVCVGNPEGVGNWGTVRLKLTGVNAWGRTCRVAQNVR